MNVTREQIVAEAYTWVGTRYHHHADVKGHGVDCAMLLVRVFVDTGAVPRFDPRPYARHWYLHRDEELYLAGLEKHSHRVEEALPGDMAIYTCGRTASHGSIICEPGYAIHAYADTGRVERTSLPEIARYRGFSFHSYWSVF